MLITALNLLALSGYLAAGIAVALNVARANPSQQGGWRWLLLAATLLHAAALSAIFSADPGLALAFVPMLSLFGWVVAVMVGVAVMQRPLDNLALILLPMIALTTLGPVIFTPETAPVPASGWRLPAHVVTSVVGYGLLTLAAVQALLLAYQERALRKHQPGRLFKALPPLEGMEAFLFQIIWAGFVFISLSLLTGFLFLDDLFAQRLVHKTVLSIVAWLVFAVLLFGRLKFGWRGRTALRYTLGGYALLVLAYFGAKFVLEVLLGRQWG